ncbi:armadillo-type protein [Scleroderma yunnanense]
MDVPFISSGAMNRVHYSLVRKVEAASSAQAADQILLNEIEVIRTTLAQPHLSVKACKESLILLLYCTMAISSTSLSDLSFAFRHAINLAEQGRSVLDKRIGYTFCVELMPPNHELQLMLVNTLRKDLESASVGYMCLAMDVLMQMPHEDVAPAVHTRLKSLLHDKNEFVRRRAYMAYYVLFNKDPDHAQHLEEVLTHANHSPAPDIISCGLIVASKLQSESMARLLNSCLRHALSGNSDSVQTILRAFRNGKVILDPISIPLILDVIKHSSDPPGQVLIDAFSLLSTVPSGVIRQSQAKLSFSPAASIRHLLTSGDPNEQYIFISCLSCLDPSAWAGNTPGSVAVFDEWEVQQIIKLLDSRDGLIRKMTLKILYSVDPGIITAYYAQLVQQIQPGFSVALKGEHILHLFDIVEVQCQGDPEQYAKHLKDLLMTVEGKERALSVLENCVERVLNYVRKLDVASRVSLVTALAIYVIEVEAHIGPTLIVIICALVCEHCGKISASPSEIIRGMVTKLNSLTPSVQDACLLLMLRLLAECNTVPEEVYKAVQELSRSAGSHIRRRCEQFLILSLQRHIVADIVSRASSTSLPDFVVALTNYQSNIASKLSPHNTPPLATDSSGRSPSGSGNKLRYDAYAAPQPVPSLRRLHSPRLEKRSLSSPRNTASGENGTVTYLNELACMATPGELTLAVAEHSFDNIQTSQVSHRSDRAGMNDKESVMDLITLDASAATDDVDRSPEPTFEEVWNSMEKSNVRGWCEVSMDAVVRLLQSLQFHMRVIAVDQPPFEGELKVLVLGLPSGKYAALRLRDGDGDSCLWRFRCDDLETRTTIKRLLENI